MTEKEETQELPLEERAKTGFREEFDQSACKKKNASKEFYLCKEPEKAPICSYAIQIVSGKYYCKKQEQPK